MFKFAHFRLRSLLLLDGIALKRKRLRLPSRFLLPLDGGGRVGVVVRRNS
jgi:hypothetical protein